MCPTTTCDGPYCPVPCSGPTTRTAVPPVPQAQEEPHRLLALTAAAARAGLREEPLRGGAGAKDPRQQAAAHRDSGGRPLRLCLSVCLSCCLSVCLSCLCLPVHLLVCLSVCPSSLCLSCSFVCLSVCPSCLCLFVCLSCLCLFVCLSANWLSVCLASNCLLFLARLSVCLDYTFPSVRLSLSSACCLFVCPSCFCLSCSSCLCLSSASCLSVSLSVLPLLANLSVC